MRNTRSSRSPEKLRANMKRLAESELRRRLGGAAQKGVLGLFVLVACTAGYYAIIWFARRSLWECIESFARVRTRGLISLLILCAPVFFLPKLYQTIRFWIADTQELCCPACGALLEDEAEWQLILINGRCPACREDVPVCDRRVRVAGAVDIDRNRSDDALS